MTPDEIRECIEADAEVIARIEADAWIDAQVRAEDERAAVWLRAERRKLVTGWVVGTVVVFVSMLVWALVLRWFGA